MHHKLFSWILLFATLVLLCLPAQCASTEKCLESEMEDNILKIVGYISDTRFSYPKNDKEFTKFCSENNKAANRLSKISSQCLRGSSKTIIGVFAYSSLRTNRRFCNSKSNSKARNDMVSYANCVNPNKSLVKNCYRTFINKLNLTQSIENDKNRIPYMCCLGSQLVQCVVSELSKTKHKACTAEIIQSYGDFFDSISSNIMNSVCDGTEDSSDRCNKILMLPKGKLTKVNHKSPFPIIISIFDSL